MPEPSEAERAFVTRWIQLNDLGPLPPVMRPQYEFDPDRKWAFDFAWPSRWIAVEIEGGTWMRKGGHTTGKGFEKDCVKYNRAAELGWTVLRYTPQMIAKAPDVCIAQICGMIRG